MVLFSILPTFAQPTSEDRILELDGNGAHVELPPNMFGGLTAATVEGWVRWDEVRSHARFFDFGAAGALMGVYGDHATKFLQFEISRSNLNPLAAARSSEPYLTNQWTHVAAVSGPGGMKLYLNGILTGTNAHTGSFAWIGSNPRNFLGRSNAREAGQDSGAHFKGRMGEVRIWSQERTAEQIHSNLFTRMTGREPGLFALYNFADPSSPARDATGKGRDGALKDGAKIVTSPRSERDSAVLPTLIAGKVTDSAGEPLRNADVVLSQNGSVVKQVRSGLLGTYRAVLHNTNDLPFDFRINRDDLGASVSPAGRSSGCRL